MAIRHDEHPTERVERVEAIEHVHDGPAVTSPPAANLSARAPTPVWTVTSVVTLFFTVLEVVLLLRFVFKLAGANANQPLVAALYSVTEPLVRPFQGIFPDPAGPPILEVAAVLAIVFLLLIGALMVALVRAITAPRAI